MAVGALLYAYLLGVADNKIVSTTTDDGQILLALLSEGYLVGGVKRTVQARGQDFLKWDVGELTQAFKDSQAGGKDEGILNEGAVVFGMVFKSHGEFGGNDGPDENGLASAHGQGEDVAGVVKRQGFVDGLELVTLNEFAAFADFLPQGIGAASFHKFVELVLTTEKWFSRNLCDPQRHAAPGMPRTRLRSRSKLARPYICRFTNLSRLICPSTWPPLHS
jgi:hypothetical protein